jgi:hypothetical protein
MNDAPLPAAVELERPRFQRPPGPPAGPGPTMAEPDPEATPSQVRSPSSDGPAPEAGSTSASPGKPRSVIQGELAAAVAGALMITAALAGWLLRRPGRRLRKPLKADYKAVAAPVARIVVRHVPVDLAPGIALSIYDGCEATAAFMGYAERGPLLEPERDPEPPPDEALSDYGVGDEPGRMDLA